MTKDLLLAIGVMISVGLFGGLLANRLKFPRVTGYIIIGVLLSPSILNLVPRATIESWDIITSVILGIIAYAIGGSLDLVSLRKLGKSTAWITPLETLGAWLVVTLLMVFLAPMIFPSATMTFREYILPMALVAGSIAGATAPAATLAVIREYKARGNFTMTLLSVVALDDALSIITFAIAMAVALPLASGAGSVSLYQMLSVPFLDIIKSIGIGTALGFAIIYLTRLIKTRALLLTLVLGIIMLCIGLTDILGGSLILANMVVGFVVRNRTSDLSRREEPFVVIQGIEDFAFAVFFVLAGMHFDSSVIKVSGFLALLIMGGRFVGQYFGAAIGAKISKASDLVRKYLGFALQAQAGVTVGLALLIREAFPTFGDIVFNGFLASIIISEIFAPPLVKYALFKAGEVEEATKPTPGAK
jgi:Kef-type K+ transport system membrane component KefB